jgi:uncharacterized HAD superfamily protein
LYVKNWEIFYITSRKPELADVTKAWVRGMRLPDKENTFVVDGGKRAKVELLELEYFIEDRPKHVEELYDITELILLTRDWNKDLTGNFTRINNLSEIREIIK